MKTNFKFPYKCLAVASIALIMSSCRKQDVVSPTFDVTLAKTTLAVNEPIVWSYTGTADIIDFYSGATGSEYQYKNRTTLDGKPQLQFTSNRAGTSTQTGTLTVLVSQDFDNTFTVDDLQKATWKDITARATLATAATDTPSGVIDLSDVSGTAPVFIAFRYTAKMDAVNAQPTWNIKSFAVTNLAADGTSAAIVSQSTMSWGSINVLNISNIWGGTTTSALTFTGGAINAADNEDWIISQPIQLNRAQPTFSTSLRISPTAKVIPAPITGYTKAGTYTATFEAINANKWGQQSTIKQFTITVQ